MKLPEYLRLREQIASLAPETLIHGRSRARPTNAVDIALRTAFVIVSASLRYSSVQRLWPALRQNLLEGGEVGNAFKHAAKVRAINAAYAEREAHFAGCETAAGESDEATIALGRPGDAVSSREKPRRRLREAGHLAFTGRACRERRCANVVSSSR
jgi:hypothetical protein